MTKFQEVDISKAPNDLAKEILIMFNKDQTARFSNINPEEIKQIDINNTKRLKEIIAERGYPTIREVGEEASNALWLLIQHADLDRDFQKQCLELMKKVQADQINKKNIAYLEDRVRIGEAKPQLYGTQFHRRPDGKLILREIEDVEGIDKRRKEMGLNTLEEYKKEFYSKCPKESIPENQDPDYSEFKKVFGLDPESYFETWNLEDLKILIKDPLIGIEMIGSDKKEFPESVLVKTYSNTIVADQIPCNDLIVATLRVLLKKYSS